MAEYMLWVKAFHIVAVVCWFAGLFYLPRLYVYHRMSQDQVSRKRFEVMERKLYRGIMWPSLVATWLLGLVLLYLGWSYYKTQSWLHVKLLLVIFLTAYHISCGYFRKALINNPQIKSHQYFRWFNEVPVLVLIAVCVLAVVKPQF